MKKIWACIKQLVFSNQILWLDFINNFDRSKIRFCSDTLKNPKGSMELFKKVVDFIYFFFQKWWTKKYPRCRQNNRKNNKKQNLDKEIHHSTPMRFGHLLDVGNYVRLSPSLRKHWVPSGILQFWHSTPRWHRWWEKMDFGYFPITYSVFLGSCTILSNCWMSSSVSNLLFRFSS